MPAGLRLLLFSYAFKDKNTMQLMEDLNKPVATN
jgi:hypothetical protein